MFISYERTSAQTARRVVDLLRELGHRAWFDADLPLHRVYADVIREKLDQAAAVVVLWSAAAAKSEWVRAEADHARQQRKIVQASLDGADLPMPFNQIQFAQLQHWGGDSEHAEWRKIVAAVEALVGEAAAAPRTAPPAGPSAHLSAPSRPPPAPRHLPWPAIAVSAALGAAAIVGGMWFVADRTHAADVAANPGGVVAQRAQGAGPSWARRLRQRPGLAQPGLARPMRRQQPGAQP